MKEEQKSALESLETAPKAEAKKIVAPKQHDLTAELELMRQERDAALAEVKKLKYTITGLSPELEAKMAKQRERDKTPVTGFFRNLEAPGDTLKFVYKKYKGDPIETYEFKDGEAKTIPYGVAQHINDKGKIPEHRNVLDDQGKMVSKITTNRRRFVFSSTEFVLEPEVTLSTVSNY
jgi:hypothetical protein